MKLLIVFFLVLLLNSSILSQDNFDYEFPALDFTLSYRGLTREDLTIPVSFDPNKSSSAETRLILPIVKDLMKEPLKYNGFIEEVKSYKDISPEEIILKLFELINYNRFPLNLNKDNIAAPERISEFEGFILSFIREAGNNGDRLLSVYSNEEVLFLRDNIFAIISDSDTGLEDKYSDIFKYNESRDSSIKISKKVMDLLDKLDRRKIFTASLPAFYFVNALSENKLSLKSLMKTQKLLTIKNKFAEGEFYYYYDKDGIRIAVGNEGRNIYKGFFDLIIDIGGDDIYEVEHTENKFFSCIIDYSGNDTYDAKSDFTLAGGFFASSFLFDYSGNDIYKGRSVSLGAAIGGIGLLLDSSGSDVYSSRHFSQAAASFGIGILIDSDGNDLYRSIAFSQGIGMTEGGAMLLDKKGADSYLADLQSLDIGRYEDHYVSMMQGYAYGVRPYYAGGAGILLDAEGNDLYYTDIFGQGGAYWYGLGMLIDISGHDKYNSYQYAQGSGIHLAVGILKDFDGWDSYISNGVSQGCGHDYGVGILHDVKGNDNYSAYSLSQGAGSANGIGILMDDSGRDGYLSKEDNNTRGYGNPRREFGSLGIMADASGEDFYSQRGPDSVMINSSVWGVMADYYLQDIQSQFIGNTFTIELSGRTDYSPEEYFIMAETIEPRFSKWQELGFNKLLEDSINTAKLFLTKLATDDHRETSLMRNVIIKIPYAISSVFAQKLDDYLKEPALLSPKEASLMAYLFGFTNNPSGRESLYRLTHDNDIRVRANAINSLGKLELDPGSSEHKDFIKKVAARLKELANQKADVKLYMKDIAFAMNLYRDTELIPSLIEMMNFGYFPVRMLSAEALQKYGNEYYYSLNNIILEQVFHERKWLQALITSLKNLNDESFRNIISRIIAIKSGIADEIICLNIAGELKIRSESTNDSSFKAWAESNYSELIKNSRLKILAKP